MEDGFSIASRPIAVPAGLESRTKSGVIVDLAVVGDPDRLVLVCHRLMSASHVHDRQSPMPQAHRSLGPKPFAVRPPMAQDVAHAFHTRLVHEFPGVQTDDACYAAHEGLPALDDEHWLVELDAVMGALESEPRGTWPMAFDRPDGRRRIMHVPNGPKECHDAEGQERQCRVDEQRRWTALAVIGRDPASRGVQAPFEDLSLER